MNRLIRLARKAIEENMYDSDLALELELMYEEMVLNNDDTSVIECVINEFRAIKKG